MHQSMTRKFRPLVAIEGCAARLHLRFMKSYCLIFLSNLGYVKSPSQLALPRSKELDLAWWQSQRTSSSSLCCGLFGLSLTFFGIFRIFGGKSLVLFSDLVELFHVLLEIGASLQGDEKLGLLAISLLPLHSDGSGSDLLEDGIFVSKKRTMMNYVKIDVLGQWIWTIISKCQ